MADYASLIQASFGLLAFIAIAWGFGETRRLPDWRLVLAGLGLQFGLALLMFKVSFVQQGLAMLNQAVVVLSGVTEAGTSFVFGYLGGDPGKMAYPYEITDPGATYVLAFRALPLIMFFTVLSAILWHYRILPLVIRGFSAILKRSMGVSGAVGVSAAGNLFLGMVEAPLLIRPYIGRLTRSELFIVMTCGMATVAGSMMIFYSIILQDVLTDSLGHILTASVISAPAAIMIARIMIPGTDSGAGDDQIVATSYDGLLDAIAQSTTDGVRLMVNVGAMLIILSALVALANSALTLLPMVAEEAVTLERMLGWLFAPLVFLMGIPWEECVTAGSLMGVKTVLNELLAFFALAALEPGQLSAKSTLIMTYAICGFANFGSLGIMIGGLGAICPERRNEIMALSPKSLIAGTLATCMTGAVAGLILG